MWDLFGGYSIGSDSPSKDVCLIQPVGWHAAAAVRLCEDGFHQVRLFRPPNMVREIVARERQVTLSRKVFVGRHSMRKRTSEISTSFGESRGKLDRPREGLTLGRKPHRCENQRREKRTPVCFFPPTANKERRTGKIAGTFSGMRGALDGRMLARALASPAQGLHRHELRYNIFRHL